MPLIKSKSKEAFKKNVKAERQTEETSLSYSIFY